MPKRSLQDAFAPKTQSVAPAPKPEADAQRPPSRRGLKGLTVWVDPAIHLQLRMMALEQGRSSEDMLREAIGDLFQKHGRPRAHGVARNPHMDWSDPAAIEAWTREKQERAPDEGRSRNRAAPRRRRHPSRRSSCRFASRDVPACRGSARPRSRRRDCWLPPKRRRHRDSSCYPCTTTRSSTAVRSWLLEMYRRAETIQRIRGPMPLSFAVMLGALVTTAISDRTGREVITRHTLDEVIGWGYPTGWNQRARDWVKLHRAFEELPSYRVPVGEYLVWLVIGEGLPRVYHQNARVLLRKRVPASAAYGIRIDWPQLLRYRPSALMTRAYLSVHALMDRSAHRGHALTRLIHEPELDADGKPRRRKGGEIVRSERLVPNPLANKVGVLPGRDVARFLGMKNSKSGRQDVRQALSRLHSERIVEVIEEQGGYRFYGVLPEKTVRST